MNKTIRAQTKDGYKVTIPITFKGYTIKKTIGSGSTSIVCLIENDRKQLYSAKIIPKKYIRNRKMYSQINTEIYVMKECNHPNIVQCKVSFSDEFNHYIVLEYCPGKSVRDYLRKSEKGYLSESETRKILNDVVNGLIYLHNHKIIHHDIKLENFLIGQDGKVKIADFGVSTMLKDEKEKKYSFCGTVYYLSPEIVEKEKRHRKQDSFQCLLKT